MPCATTLALVKRCCCLSWTRSHSQGSTLHDSLISPQQCCTTGGPDVATAPEPQQADSRLTSLQQLIPAGSSNSCPDLQQLEQDHKLKHASPFRRPSSPEKPSKATRQQNNSASSAETADSPNKRKKSNTSKPLAEEGIELKPAERNPCLGVNHIVAADRSFVKARPGA